MKKQQKNNPIRVGLWGIGRAGWLMHCSELAQFPEMFRITAACDVIPERAEAVAKRFGAKAYTDGDRFLADPDVELVSVIVRSKDHVKYALRALEAGKTVFLEKPFALSEKGVRLLEEAVKKYPGKLYFRHNRRFEAAFNHIRDIIDSGILGKVFEIKLRRHLYRAREDWQTLLECGGGIVNNWGPHLIDHSLRLLESPLKDVWSDFRREISRGDAEDHIKIIFRGENGRLIDLEISDAVAIPSNVYEVYGTRGTLVSKNESDLQMKYLDPKFKIPPRKATKETLPWDVGYGDSNAWKWRRETIMTEPANGYTMTDIYKYLYEAVRLGKPFPVKPEEALQVVRVTSMIRKQHPEFKSSGDNL